MRKHTHIDIFANGWRRGIHEFVRVLCYSMLPKTNDAIMYTLFTRRFSSSRRGCGLPFRNALIFCWVVVAEEASKVWYRIFNLYTMNVSFWIFVFREKFRVQVKIYLMF